MDPSRPPTAFDVVLAVVLLVVDAAALGMLLFLSALAALGSGAPEHPGQRAASVPSPWWLVAAMALIALSGVALWRGGWFWAGGTQIVVAVLLAGAALLSVAEDRLREGASRPGGRPAPGASAPGTVRADVLPVRAVVRDPLHRLAAEPFERVDGGGAAGEAEEEGGDHERPEPVRPGPAHT
ncbi:DUF6234 family protein [Streptomyces roseolus]|uniref:DUF6234 family protein n=1 Tax=Streptomyces roseolus TaxID=67358 RepID=UPI001676B003|nr:DUF6234 family protein [Streptomyces roseolus]GGR38599.1 hypothetical protein GCM10010282_34040 [Streptomyces roseolus]